MEKLLLLDKYESLSVSLSHTKDMSQIIVIQDEGFTIFKKWKATV